MLRTDQTDALSTLGNHAQDHHDTNVQVNQNTADIATHTTAIAGKYAKPAGGIPKTDLDASTQTSLGKADSALQSAPVASVNTKTGTVVLTPDDLSDTSSTNKFTNAADKSKLAAITGTNTGDETTATIKTKLGITTLSGANTGDQTNITGTAGTITGSITESQVTNLTADLAAKQATLVSGTNIKTVNGTSLLGAGDIAIAGGGGTAPDATTTAKGIVQLAGDLAGTAAAPTVPGLTAKAATTYVDSQDALKVSKTGDTMTGQLDVSANITSTGIIYSSNGFANKASANNAYYQANTTGATISRNIADANTALTVNQSNASSTGKLLDLQLAGVSKLSVDNGGGMNIGGSILSRNINPASNNAYNVGNSTTYFANLYAVRYYMNSTAFLDGATAGQITVTGLLSTPSLQVTGGTPAAGKVLTSDASGNATWQTAPGAGSGSGDMTKAVYDPAGKNAQLAADSEVVKKTGSTMTGGLHVVVPNGGNSRALDLEQLDTTNSPMAAYIRNSSTGEAFRFEQNGVLAGGKTAFAIFSNQAHASGDSYLFKMENNNAASTIPMALWKNFSANDAFLIENNTNTANTYVLNLTANGSAGSVIKGNLAGVTPTGNLIQLQTGGVDKFKVDKDGNLTTVNGSFSGTMFVGGVDVTYTLGQKASLTGTETLTNKTLTLPTIGGTGANFNGATSGATTLQASGVAGATTVTLPASNTTLVGYNTVDTLSNKTLDDTTVATVKDGNFTLEQTADITRKAKFALTNSSTGTTLTFNLPNNAGTLATVGNTETLTNKTLTSPVMTTPTLGVATATTVNKVTITAPTTSATLTLAQGSTLATAGAFSTTLTATGATNVTLPTTGTLATQAGAETLTNKTLTTPKIAQINDANGAASIINTATTSAVNQITVTNAATTVSPSIAATGTDVNLDLVLTPKGTGRVSTAANLTSGNEHTMAGSASAPATPATGKGTFTMGGTTNVRPKFLNESGVLETIQTSTQSIVPYKFSVYRAAAFSPAVAAVVQFDTKSFDTGSNVDIVTNKGRFTAPIAGFYSFSANLSLSYGGSGNIFSVALYKNGVILKQGTQTMSTASQTICGNVAVASIQLAAGDFIEVYSLGASTAVTTGAAYTSFDGCLESTL